MTRCVCGMKPPPQPTTYVAKRSYNTVLRWELKYALFREQHAHCIEAVAA